MKKILFAAVNARYTHTNLALYYLRTIALQYRYDLEMFHASVNMGQEQFISTVASRHTDILVLSAYIWNAQFLKDVLPRLKNVLPGSVIIMGGPEVSYNYREWIDSYPQIDFIIAGGGERAFDLLCKQDFNHGTRVLHMPNFRFEEIPFPYIDRDFDDLKTRYVYYESSRGCLFSCSYCLSSRGDQVLEYKDVGTVIKELRIFLKHKPGTVKFVDRTFNARKQHARAIWKFLLEEANSADNCFHFEIFPGLLDDDDFLLLSQAVPGLFQFEIGIQSITARALDLIHRPAHWKRIRSNVERLVQLGNIHIHVDQLAGLPGETPGQLKKSFNAIYDLGADRFQVGVLKVLPGTLLDSQKKELGILHQENQPYTVIQNKWCSKDFITEITGIADLVDLLYNSGKFYTAIGQLVSCFRQPYQMYKKMLLFVNKKGLNISSHTWERGAELILGFVKQHLAGEYDFIYDCLVWDFCITARTHKLPSIIRTPKTAVVKKKVCALLKGYRETGEIRIGTVSFPVEFLKTSLFFQPVSEKFRDLFVSPYRSILVLPDKQSYLVADRNGDRIKLKKVESACWGRHSQKHITNNYENV